MCAKAMSDQPSSMVLLGNSPLRRLVQTGIRAVAKAHHHRIARDLRPEFSESIDLDRSLRDELPDSRRWDYLLVHAPSRRVLALEIHPASPKEVKVIIAKKRATAAALRTHLLTHVAVWYWAASGKSSILKTGTGFRSLSQAGIIFVGSQLQRRHL